MGPAFKIRPEPLTHFALLLELRHLIDGDRESGVSDRELVVCDIAMAFRSDFELTLSDMFTKIWFVLYDEPYAYHAASIIGKVKVARGILLSESNQSIPLSCEPPQNLYSQIKKTILEMLESADS